MNYQLKGFQFSFIIHAFMLFIIINISSAIVPMSKTIVIDFSIEDSTGGKLQEPAKKASDPLLERRERIVRRVQEEVKTSPVREEKTETRQEETLYESPVEPFVSDAQVSVPAPIPSEQHADSEGEVHNLPAGGITAGSSGETVTAVAYGTGFGDSDVKTGMRYLKAHFAYIRDLIIRNISYPDIARRNGWEGMVTVSFVISGNGYAKDIKIKESSGFEILDKNAIMTIKKVSPFPKPPAEALIKIPIVYKLTNN